MTPRRYHRRLYATILYRVLVDNVPVKDVARELGLSSEMGRKKIYHVIERYSITFHEKRNGEIWGIKIMDLRTRTH
ncbi:MAG: hypothetical protein E6Q97_35030 [Desulfurellales bacterium]|nr:MAG: hypothetical protein E6Q97_35030 [Desulfurellales bacterium]